MGNLLKVKLNTKTVDLENNARKDKFSFKDFYPIFVQKLVDSGRIKEEEVGTKPKSFGAFLMATDTPVGRAFDEMVRGLDDNFRLEVFKSFSTGKFRYLPKEFTYKDVDGCATEVYYEGYFVARTPFTIGQMFDSISVWPALAGYFMYDTWFEYLFLILCYLYKDDSGNK